MHSPRQASPNRKNDGVRILDKDFKNGWFKKNSGFIIDSIAQLLADFTFSYTTVRLSILLLANIHTLTKGGGAIRTFLKRQDLLELLNSCFEEFNEGGLVTIEEIDEL